MTALRLQRGHRAQGTLALAGVVLAFYLSFLSSLGTVLYHHSRANLKILKKC